MHRLNCWEYMDCGRQPGGKRVDLVGPCPAALCDLADGINHGQAAGRCCWTLDGTLCPDTGEHRIQRCRQCPFFQHVAQEEGADFVPGQGIEPPSD